MQRSRRLLVVVTIALIVGLLAAAVVVPRSTLTTRRDAADASFLVLRPSLDARYATVPPLLEALDEAGARDRTPTRALRTALARWTAAAKGTDPTTLTDAANAIEGDVARTRALVGATPALAAVNALRDAYATYDQTEPNARLVDDNTSAVAAYNSARHAIVRRLAVAIGGFGPRPAYIPITP